MNKNKKSTIKYKRKSPMNYQMGGFPALEQFTNLNNQWGNFWKGGNYFSAGQTSPIGVYADPNAMLYNTVNNNQGALDVYNSNQDFNKRTGASEWGNTALDYGHRQEWNNRNPNATDADKARFDNYQNFYNTYEGKAAPEWDGTSTLVNGAPGSSLGDYNAWKIGRTNAADYAKQEWSKNNSLYTDRSKVANKQMGEAMTNSAAGLFSGLNYQNAYKEPEPINLQQGFQGVEYAQYGGNTNLTGYTPNTPTMGNKINTIPGGNISMSNTPFPVVGIGKDGLTKIMQPGQQYDFGYNDNVNELPLQQFGGNTQNNKSVFNSLKSKGYLQEYDENSFNRLPAEEQNALFKQAASDFNSKQVSPQGQIIQEIRTPLVAQLDTSKTIPKETSFDAAFLQARKQGLDTFNYDGQKYNTKIDPNAKATSFKSSSPQTINTSQSGLARELISSRQFGGIAGALSNINLQQVQDTYLSQLTSSDPNDPYSSVNATPEFNRRMISGITNPQTQSQNQVQNTNIAMLPTINPSIVEPLSSLGFNRDKLAAEMSINTNNIKLVKGGTQKVANYQQMLREKGYDIDVDGAWGPKTQKAYEDFTGKKSPTKTAIQTGKAKVFSNITKSSNSTYNLQVTSRQYGGSIELPKLQFGGEINNDHTYPIHPITEEFMEIQTEYGETIMLPDGTIVNVKASDRHKNMDKDEVTDILPEGAYVFSADPKMKFSVNSKIGTTKVEDMNLGQSVFEYKENEITPGPEKIYVKDVFFGNSKKELTTAEISNNIKKKFELRDQKNDFFVDRAVEENKEQRVEYLSILKAMNEFKKPKSKREVPQAQYGMDISSMLPMQSTQNALDGVMGYSNRAMDPFKRMDNTRLNMFNTSFKQPSLPSIPKMYAEGGDVPHAQLGKLLRYTVPVAYIGSEYFGNKAKKKQEKINNEEMRQWDSLTGDYIDNVNKTGGIDMLTNIGTYAASLNVPRQAYDNMSQQSALQNEGYNRQRAILNADKYSAQNSLGAGTSMARFAGNNQNLGQYLAASQQGYNGQVSGINSQLAQLEGNNTSARIDLTSQGNNNYNNSLNAFNTQVYNANVTGLGNVGRSVGTANANLGNAKYMTGQERLSLLRQQRDAAQAAKDKVVGDWEGALGSAGQIAMMAAGIPGGLGGGQQPMGQTTINGQTVPSNFNPAFTSSASQQFNPSFVLPQPMQPTYNMSPGALRYDNWSMRQSSPANQQFTPQQNNPFGFTTNTVNPNDMTNFGNPYGFNFNGFNIYN